MTVLEEKKLRIAMLGHKRIPSREGGVEVVVEELAVRMVEKGYSVTCFNRSGHHVAGARFDAAGAENYRGVRCTEVFTVNRRGLAAMTSSFAASLRAGFGKYDVVHVHAEGPAFFSFIPKLCGKRVVVTVHGLDWARAKWGRFASWFIRTGEKNAVRFADEIIVLSKAVGDYFAETYGRKTVFIPNGASRQEKKEPLEINKWGLEKDGYVLYLGRIVPEKGERYLIEAFKNIKTDKKLVIAGGSSDTDAFMTELKNMARDDDRIIFTGFIQGRTLEELYSSAYVYCLPSDLEGMPLSLLEAMSFGCCCLVSDIPECAEVVGDKAVTFRKGDTADLRERLEQLLADPDKVEGYKAGAADHVCEKYSWDDVAERTAALYRGAEK